MTPEVEGLQLGHYRLTRRIGAGGMGEVYLAQDLALKREVAIKFVIAEGGGDAALARRLMHEAQAVAALDHPCICPVHDVGVDPSGRPYMVMQDVPGETLAARLARGPLPPREALGLCAQIADALSAAHRHGIIHRDLKPQNVMLTPSGAPKLLDFGIAKVLPSLDTAAAGSETASSLTSRHAIVGTPAYMSPEQVYQRPLDGRSDLFSLGAILFEALTGQRAFGGAQLAEVLGAVLHVHPPAPSSLCEGLDERHDELVRRLLAKEPSDRFQSADEVVGALRLLQPDTSRTPLTQGPARPRSRVVSWLGRHRVAVGVAAALAVAASFALPRYLRPALPALPPNAQVWYDRGTEALREGSFHTAAAAFEESARIYDTHPFTYARLAEARAELDDSAGAQKALVAASALIRNESRLPADDQLRLDAIRATVLRQVDHAVALYAKLAERHPSDPAAWLDLGRAQEAAGQTPLARTSYERAVALGSQFPAAFLRLGTLLSNAGDRDRGLQSLAEAERLYRTARDPEGEAEVLLRKATALDARGEFAQARAVLDRAMTLAQSADSPSLLIRAQLRLCSLDVSEGKLAEAEQLAGSTVQRALENGLQPLAADGLVDLAAVMQQRGKVKEAEAQARRAIDLARRERASRTVARAQSQLGSVLLTASRFEEALAVLPPALEFFKANQYRALELTTENVAARALRQLDRIDEARAMLSNVVRVAEQIGDRRQMALALTGLYGLAVSDGDLPEALEFRVKAEAIHREQQDVAQLPFDLTNRAETLILLGRMPDAAAALDEIDAAIAQGKETYVERRRRVAYLRALAGAVTRQYDAAGTWLGTLAPGTDGTAADAALLAAYVDAHRPPARRAPLPSPDATASASAQRQMQYLDRRHAPRGSPSSGRARHRDVRARLDEGRRERRARMAAGGGRRRRRAPGRRCGPRGGNAQPGQRCTVPAAWEVGRRGARLRGEARPRGVARGRRHVSWMRGRVHETENARRRRGDRRGRRGCLVRLVAGRRRGADLRQERVHGDLLG